MQQPDNQIDPKFLLRHLDRQTTDAEQAVVAEWLARDEANRVEFARLEQAWRLAARAPDRFDLDALWTRISRQIDAESAGEVAVLEPEGGDTPVAPAPAAQPIGTSPSGPRLSTPPSARSRWRSARLGSVLAVVLLLVGGLYVAGVELVPGAEEPRFQAFTTRAGEVMTVTLPDRSTAVLAGATTLSVPEDFGENSREIRLEGEAFFDVAPGSPHNFRVHTSWMTVEDLGTRFTVSAYAGDPHAAVAVVHGAVEVSGTGSDESIILYPSDVAHVSATGSIHAMRGAGAERYTSWMDGQLQFDQAAVSVAARAIQRRFGIEVRVADSTLAHRRFTGAVSAATLYDDLRALAFMLDARYEATPRGVVLSSHRGPERPPR